MPENRQPGRSMGLEYDGAAMRLGQHMASHEFLMMQHAFSNRAALNRAFERYHAGESLTTQQAGLVAEIHSMAAFLHVLRYTDDMVAPDPEGRPRNWATSVYRLKDFYRMVEFLRLTGIIKESALESNKLILGVSAVLPDVYPFAYQFEVRDIERFQPDGFNAANSQQAREFFDGLVDNGVVTVRQREGHIIGVDDDDFSLSMGASMLPMTGLDVETHLDNGRAFVHNHHATLKRDNIGLIVIARLDPLLAGGNTVVRSEWQKKVTRFADELTAIAAAAKLPTQPKPTKGQILISIGSGKKGKHDFSEDYHQWEEYRERERTLGAMKSSLIRNGTLLHQDMAAIPACEPWLLPELSDLVVMVANSPRRQI